MKAVPVKEKECVEIMKKNNGRISNADVAKMVGCSARTVVRARQAYASGCEYKDSGSMAKCREELEKNPNRSNSEIATIVGCHPDTVGRVRRSLGCKPATAKVQYNSESTEGALVHDEDYYYDQHNDIYVVTLSKSSKPLTISGEVMRDMRRDYSDIDGSKLNVNEICVKYGIPFTWFMELKKKMRWTHKDITFTDEEVKEKDVDALVDEALENKKRAFILRYQKRHLEAIKADAQKWQDFQYGTLNPWNIAFTTPLEYRPSLVNIGASVDTPAMDMLVIVADDHFGYGKDSKKVMNGRTYDLDTAMQRMNKLGETILKDCKSMKFRANNVFLMSMGDTYDAETTEKTAAGTHRPQIATPEEIWTAVTKAHADLTLNLSRISGSLHRFNVVGNHAPFMDFALETYLQALFSHVSGISVNPNDKPGVSFKIRDTQIVGHHGKGLAPSGCAFGASKEVKGSTILTNWFKDDFVNSKYHELFLAHVHHRVHAEMSQYNLHLVPSIMGPDTYSDSLILQSSPGAVYYLIGDDGIAFERFVKL